PRPAAYGRSTAGAPGGDGLRPGRDLRDRRSCDLQRDAADLGDLGITELVAHRLSPGRLSLSASSQTPAGPSGPGAVRQRSVAPLGRRPNAADTASGSSSPW